MKNLKELEQKYLELGKEIEVLKKQSEEEEIKYPIFCKSIQFPLVVKFTGLESGEVVVSNFYKIGHKSINWIKHTDTNEWQQLNICEKTGFFDGQLVWCWDKYLTHVSHLRFYDIKNKCTYQFNGTKKGRNYDNYAPYLRPVS